MPTIEPGAAYRMDRFAIRPRRRRRFRRRGRRWIRAILLAGFGLLLVLLALEPLPPRRSTTPLPPPPEGAAAIRHPAAESGLATVALAPLEPRGGPAIELPIPLVQPPIGEPMIEGFEAPHGPSEPSPSFGDLAAEPTPPGERERLAGDLARARGGELAALVPLPASPPVEPKRAVPADDPPPVAPAALAVPRLRGPSGPAPALTVILDDLGTNRSATRRAIRLPGPLTLAFLAYAEATPELAREAAAAGHEVFVHLAMEPLGGEDPGPMALLSGLAPEELRRRLRWAVERVPGAVGVNNHMGSRLTADRRAMTVVMDELVRLGLPFVDSRTTSASVALPVALRAGVPATGRDLFLDHDPRPTAILAQLERAERLARRTGSAVLIGHPYPSTLEVLESWLPRARERGLRLVPATRMIALRDCVAGATPVPECLVPAALAVEGPPPVAQ